LKNTRLKKGISLRSLAEEIGAHFTAIAHIERGERYPPKKQLKKFAEFLSLSPQQLEALIAVERRGLNPHVLLPEISPADISNVWIEKEAEKALRKFCQAKERPDVPLPVPIEQIVSSAYGLSTRDCDFEKEKDIVGGSGRALCGGLYPEGFQGQDRVVVVNAGRIRGKQMSLAEKQTTIAHEAGHYALHCGNKDSSQLFLRFSKGPSFCREAECDQDSFNSLECQASAFGACLLMPREPFRREWQKQAGSAPKLAEIFLVTEAFVRLRARMLNCE